MIMDLSGRKRTGKEESDFFFEYSPEYELADIPNVKTLNPVSVCGTVTLTGQHSAYVEGEIVFTLEGECTRCLSPAPKKYSAFFAVIYKTTMIHYNNSFRILCHNIHIMGNHDNRFMSFFLYI